MAETVILKLGDALDSLKDRRGDFEHYFAAGLGVPIESCRVVDPRRGEPFPAHERCRAVVITGSPAMITENHGWSLESERWLRYSMDGGTPVLGICYGHQLLAHALGAPVGWTEQGQEIGTVTVDLVPETWADGFWPRPPRQLSVQTCHKQSVLDLPPGGRLLATNSHDWVQGFAWGRHVWGFQFHPEFDADIVRAYLQADMKKSGSNADELQRRLECTRDSEDGRSLLRAFARFAGLHQDLQ
jgi:GMP synthase (glutamine-hydrolysing)